MMVSRRTKSKSESSFQGVNYSDPYSTEYTGSIVDVSMLVGMHINRILMLGTAGNYNAYVSAVMELHQFLTPYHTGKYKEFLDFQLNENRMALQDLPPEHYRLVKPFLERKMAFAMFGKLCQLMTDCGLMPIRGMS